MSLESLPIEKRSELDITSSSTRYHLIAVAMICAVFWGVIVATIGS